jgi:hypothetical protein
VPLFLGVVFLTGALVLFLVPLVVSFVFLVFVAGVVVTLEAERFEEVVVVMSSTWTGATVEFGEGIGLLINSLIYWL